MSAPNLATICVSLLGYIKEKCTKLKLSLTVSLPTYKALPGSPSNTPSRDVLALSYDCLYTVMEEVMLVEMKMKAGVDQAAAYMTKLSTVWGGSRDVATFLEGDALLFWTSSFPSGVVAVPWSDMETKLMEWANNRLPMLWPTPTPTVRTQAARSLQLRLEGSLSGCVSALSLALFVYKSSLMESLTNFCAEEPYKVPTTDIVITIGFPKDTEVSLRKSGFHVHNISSWMEFKMWLFAQKEVRAMMKSEPNTVEFVVNNATHPGTNYLGEEVVRYLRSRRLYCSVTIVGVANNLIRHNYENLYLARDLINVWSLNRYHRPEFTKVAESSANLLRQAPKHHKNELVDTFSYKSFNLPALPPITCQLNWMRILILEDNALEHLPVSIGGLTNLFRLTLTSNKLHYIPTTISALTQLRELNINKNKFSVIPEHVCKLAGLKVLNAANNPLTSLTQSIAKLTSLVELDIKAAPTLTELPSSMGDMTGLQQLSLEKDSFENYPRSFCDGDTADKLRFLKDLQPRSVKGCQSLVILGKDAFPVLRSLGGTKKLSCGMHEIELKGEDDIPVTFLVWDFSGKDISIETAFFTRNATYVIVENSKSNTTVHKYKEIVKSVISDAKIVITYTFACLPEEDDFTPSEAHYFGSLFQGNEDFKQKFTDMVPNIKYDRPDIPTAYLQLSKFIQEQNKMFMNWSEVTHHAKSYTDDPSSAVKFLVTNGYLFYHGPLLDAKDPTIYECVFVLSSAVNLVAQLKKTLKGFQMMKKDYFITILRKLCSDNVEFSTVLSLLEKCKVLHSVDTENLFLVPFIPTYTQAQPFAEIADYPVNLVRMYSGEDTRFSLEWFLNVVTGIHSQCDGNIILSSIDTHNAVITFDFSPQPDISPSQRSISSPHLTRSPQLSTNTSLHRIISLHASTSLSINHHPPSPIEDFSPSRTPLPPSNPLASIISSPQLNMNSSVEMKPITPAIRCYLHRTPNNKQFWFVLACPTLDNPVALKIFHTILRIIQWLLQHWIESADCGFSTSCHSCFDMSGFLKSKTATCSISHSHILNALQDDLECHECKQVVEIRHIAPDLALPSVLEHPVDQSKLNKDTKIADGGCGKVYKTLISGKQAVVKQCNIVGLEYMREMVLTNTFHHDNIVTFVGFARARHPEFLAMILDYAPHGSLHALLDKGQAFAVPLITRIATEIARGMRYMHTCGVAYGDMKSDNVLLMALDLKSSDALVKLTDFGNSGYHMGFSARYNTNGGQYNKPPEAFTKEPIDMLLADIYCFGLILWELFAGKTVENYHREVDQQRKKEGKKGVEDTKLHQIYTHTSLPAATASHPLRAVMQDCLQEYPNERIASFEKIEERIRAIV